MTKPLENYPAHFDRDLTVTVAKDRKFCDKGCRQNYHYHNRIKPGRQNT